MPDEPEPNSSDLNVAIAMPCADWLTSLPAAAQICRAAADAAYRGAAGALAPFGGQSEISVVLADDALVQDLNHRFRDLDKPTNVLSFPAGDEGVAPDCGERQLGDVILALETTRREARDQAKALSAHTSHLVVHGVLHVLGYDHQGDAEAQVMEALERKILASLDIADPYLAPQAPSNAMTEKPGQSAP
jgi:probable rRNA maturation factor